MLGQCVSGWSNIIPAFLHMACCLVGRWLGTWVAPPPPLLRMISDLPLNLCSRAPTSQCTAITAGRPPHSVHPLSWTLLDHSMLSPVLSKLRLFTATPSMSSCLREETPGRQCERISQATDLLKYKWWASLIADRPICSTSIGIMQRHGLRSHSIILVQAHVIAIFRWLRLLYFVKYHDLC